MSGKIIMNFEEGSNNTVYNNTRINVKGDCHVSELKEHAAKTQMNIKQSISITGRNWNDLINLPCFRELRHYNTWTLVLKADYIDGKPASYEDMWYGAVAQGGDTIVQYTNGKWGLIKYGKL